MGSLQVQSVDADQQLLAIWRRAKGKERDALLWGDEVSTCQIASGTSLICVLQVEYLVVAVDDKAKKARLSLAQADILQSLAKAEEAWLVGASEGQDIAE